MPRLPYYAGPIASAAVTHVPPPQPGFLQSMLRDRGAGLKSAIASAFYNPETDPDAQRARHYGAQADAEEYKLQRQQGADEALATAGDRFAEYGERVIPGVTPLEAIQAAAAKTITEAAAAGVDPKQSSFILRAFALSLPPQMADALGVRANSLLDGKYLGANGSPSLARQDFVREDEQQHEGTEWEIRAETDLQKEGIASGDRRYATDVGAATDRYDADLDYRASRENNREDNYTSSFNNAYNRSFDEATGAGGTQTVTTVTKDEGEKARNPNPIARAFGAQPTPGRPPSTTRTTVTTPLPRGRSAPAAGGQVKVPPISALRDGEITDFANGESWTLVNGQPQRVK